MTIVVFVVSGADLPTLSRVTVFTVEPSPEPSPPSESVSLPGTSPISTLEEFARIVVKISLLKNSLRDTFSMTARICPVPRSCTMTFALTLLLAIAWNVIFRLLLSMLSARPIVSSPGTKSTIVSASSKVAPPLLRVKTNTSAPEPPTRLSAPRSPQITSLPLPPVMTSLPFPPKITSLPSPPSIASSPLFPKIVSFPPSPYSRSLSWPPRTKSLSSPPKIVSTPALPDRVSLPAFPSIKSLPPRPRIRSAPKLPGKTSAVSVPIRSLMMERTPKWVDIS